MEEVKETSATKLDTTQILYSLREFVCSLVLLLRLLFPKETIMEAEFFLSLVVCVLENQKRKVNRIEVLPKPFYKMIKRDCIIKRRKLYTRSRI